MPKLTGYDDADKTRIKAIACQIVVGLVESGVIPCTDEAIRAAVPDAVETARQAVTAVNEFISG